MATKTPSKGKKAAGGDKVKSAPKKARAQKPAAVEAKEPELPEPADVDEEDDEDLEDEEDEAAAKPAAAPAAAAAKKPAAKPASRGGQSSEEAPQVVPARRLTPEAKAKINELVAKGMPLGEALRAAGSWETFVAPVREEPAKLVQGRSFDGGGRPAGPRPERAERAEREEDDSDDEEPSSPGGSDDE